jgi:signal transduction histidine kinase
VEDTGTGIPEGWISQLGTPFVRPPDARNAEGHGLGLAIVKRIATLLGGDMVIASQMGKGTRVSLRMRSV